MISPYLRAIPAALILVAAASAQPAFDTSANGSLKGDYFIREVLLTGAPDGSVTAAASVTGIATFDGNGNYTFTGQGATLAGGPNPTVSLTGTYGVAANGFLEISSPAQTFLDPTPSDVDFDFGGISAIGPSAFVASATEQTNVTMLVAIPAGSNVSNSAFKGAYTAGSIDYPNASITDVREGSFTLNSDGAGNVGTVAISGSGALLESGAAQNQTDFLVNYTLAGEGSGTMNFGASTNSELVSGSKLFYISADGNIILGGSATGYDMIVGIKALPAGTGTNATANGEYFMAALEDEVDPTGETTNLLDAYYGSVNAGNPGAGTALFHNRFQSLQLLVYDYTVDSTLFDISPSGNVPFGGDTPYSYTFGDNGQAYIALGDSANASYYSLTLGLAMQSFPASGSVYLTPNGIVNSANFAPITNPIAPNELISLYGNFGAGLSNPFPATSLPLPTKLGPVSVTINGVLAPLDYVSAGQIIAQVPSSISPPSAYYAVIQVTNNNTVSNSVTVYTSNTAPGVFANPVAVGAAAAQHANYAPVSAASPAAANETIIVYTGGLGAVTPTIVPDGGPAIGFPPGNLVNDPNVSVDFSYTFSNNLSFIGATPTTAGLYQIDTAVPSGLGTLNYLDVGTTDGYTSMTTISVGTSGAARAQAVKAHRMARNRARPKKAAVKPSGRQPHRD